MATISKDTNNNILVQSGNSTQPAVYSNWRDGSVSYGADWVQLKVGNKGFRFTSDWGQSSDGALTTVNGIDVSAMDPDEIAAIIQSVVLTSDKTSGTPLYIGDTALHTGLWSAIQIVEDAVLNVATTVEADAEGAAITITDLTGVTLTAGQVYFGKWTAIQLASGTIKAYSAL